MMRTRGRSLLNWTVVICALLVPFTALAGTIMSGQASSRCGMAACHCACCQPASSPRCQLTHSACACPAPACLAAAASSPEAEAVAPYQLVMANPAAQLFISSIFHPPEKLLLLPL